jgi:hypothetical protein
MRAVATLTEPMKHKPCRQKCAHYLRARRHRAVQHFCSQIPPLFGISQPLDEQKSGT